MTKLAGLFGGDDRPSPPRVEDTGLTPAPAATATSGTVPQFEAPPQPPAPKKRGFWGRIFGRDREPDRRDDQSEPKKKGG